jgi:hypothetical protein
VGGLIDVQRLALPSRAVEGEHELAPESFTQRLLGDEGGKFPDYLGMVAYRKVGLDPVFERLQAEIF